jgi:hypothetical protein
MDSNYPAKTTVGMHFSTKEEPTKWLGPLFDSKLTFLSHIKMLQYKCLKALNIYQNVCPVPTGVRIAWFY